MRQAPFSCGSSLQFTNAIVQSTVFALFALPKLFRQLVQPWRHTTSIWVYSTGETIPAFLTWCRKVDAEYRRKVARDSEVAHCGWHASTGPATAVASAGLHRTVVRFTFCRSLHLVRRLYECTEWHGRLRAIYGQ